MRVCVPWSARKEGVSASRASASVSTVNVNPCAAPLAVVTSVPFGSINEILALALVLTMCRASPPPAVGGSTVMGIRNAFVLAGACALRESKAAKSTLRLDGGAT